MNTFDHNLIENQLIILTKQTLDIFLKQDNPSELIALYSFYYYTAKWQGTNQPKCTTDYVAKGLHWCRTKVCKVKKQLLEFGLIEDVQLKNESGKYCGHYIKMNYIFKKETIEKNQCTQTETLDSEAENQCTQKKTLDNKYTNALSANKENALSAVNNNICEVREKKSDLLNEKTPETKPESIPQKIENNNTVEIVNYLNEKADKNFRTNRAETKRLITKLLKAGFTVEDFKTVIDNQVAKWKGNPEWEEYLRPSTLFNSNKFENYLNNRNNKPGGINSNEETSYDLDAYERSFMFDV